MKYIIMGLFTIILLYDMNAQTAIPHRSILEEMKNKESIPDAPIFNLPFIDNKLEYERLVNECEDCGDVAGKHIPVDISPENTGVWTVLPSGKQIWQLRVKSPSANGLRFICDEFNLDESTYLYFKDNNTNKIHGAYSHYNNLKTNSFATDFFNTNDITILIEIHEKKKLHLPLKIHFKTVSHGLSADDFGRSAECNNDVNCAPWVTEWCYEIRATVHMLFPVEGADRRCTGVLLNTTENDFTPYILSSRHCYYFADLANSIVIYNFQSLTCDPQQNGNDRLRTNGLELLYESEGGIFHNLCHQSDDAILFRALNGSFPSVIPWNYNVYYAGWNSLSLNTGSDVTCIHHPQGDVKKISDGELKLNSGNCWRVDFTDGIVEVGSSGSPLFGPDHRVVGNLSKSNIDAEEINCEEDFTARYGKLHKYFDDIDGWLAPNSPNTVAVNGSDPIESCQDDLLLYGFFYPANDWQSENSITVQAKNTITAAPNKISTLITGSPSTATNLNNTSDYTFRAGESISLKDGFKVERGNVFKAKIGDCEIFEGCGFNYQKSNSPEVIMKEEEVSIDNEFIVIEDKMNHLSNIYPNPTTNQITIESPKQYQLRIFNLMGQQVGQMTGKQSQMNYDMSHLESGLYIFQIRYEDGTVESLKVLKQ